MWVLPRPSLIVQGRQVVMDQILNLCMNSMAQAGIGARALHLAFGSQISRRLETNVWDRNAPFPPAGTRPVAGMAYEWKKVLRR